MFVYANAAHELTGRTDATELYRACFDGTISVYLDRFLNSPRAPVPEPGDSSRDPETVREELFASFDEQGAVDRPAVSSPNTSTPAATPPTSSERSAGDCSARTPASTRTRAAVPQSAGSTRSSNPRSDASPWLPGARYLAAHTPTQRETEQTFSIVTRLHRGERLHETG